MLTLASAIRAFSVATAAAALAACGGGSNGDPEPPPGTMIVSSERASTPFVEQGQAVFLEVVIYKPPGSGPFPTVVFNHGSTGFGNDPALFTVTYTHEALARFFVDRGWLVAFPQRRGRGRSGGIYDEGFEPDRSRYSCRAEYSLPGVDHALADIDAAVDYLRSRSDVDTTRMLSGGISRGGILAIAHAARRPDVFRGAFNFVGGWLGEGCVDAALVNRSTFVRGAAFPIDSLWMYGENDSFYSIAHSRASFDAFVAAGGQAEFQVYRRAAGADGHFIVDDVALWASDVDRYVRAHQ